MTEPQIKLETKRRLKERLAKDKLSKASWSSVELEVRIEAKRNKQLNN